MYGEDFRYGIDNPGAPALADVANDGNPISSAVHLKMEFQKYQFQLWSFFGNPNNKILKCGTLYFINPY